MPFLTIGDNLFEVGAIHPDRILFDCLMPTPHGTTYNAYLIVGKDKTALIDTVDPEKTSVLMDNLAEAGVDHIDYIVSLHTEQDHSGSIETVLRKYPEAIVVANAKVKEMAITHLHLAEDKIKLIAEGDKLELGGKTLQFTMIPFAHWPDNYMAHLLEDNILFSSDLFGSHFSSPNKAFSTSSSDQVRAAKHYYAEIMMPYRTHVQKYVAKVRQMGPRMIAPSHGPIWSDPEVILSGYERWTGDAVKRLVTIPYISMHDSTRVMVDRLAVKLSEQGLSVVCRNLGEDTNSMAVETGHFITDLVDAAAVVFASSTVLGGPHPAVAYAALVANAMRPKTKFFGLIGSFGWGTQITNIVNTLTANLKVERLDPVLVKGLPRDEDLKHIDALAKDLADKILALPELTR
ncbi:MAG: putative flavoprotein [Firmicutes bacterium]|nr:putative flavoprotein [Bacillota bacterium]